VPSREAGRGFQAAEGVTFLTAGFFAAGFFAGAFFARAAFAGATFAGAFFDFAGAFAIALSPSRVVRISANTKKMCTLAGLVDKQNGYAPRARKTFCWRCCEKSPTCSAQRHDCSPASDVAGGEDDEIVWLECSL
jgi:hypothetical protein